MFALFRYMIGLIRLAIRFQSANLILHAKKTAYNV
jgi:hypothetical protein